MDKLASNNFRRIGWLAAALAGITCIAVVTPLVIHSIQEHKRDVAARLSPITASDAEQRDILRAVLQSRAGLLVPPGKEVAAVLVNTTVDICNPDPADQDCAAPPLVDSIYTTDLDSDIPHRLRLELIAANDHAVRAVDPGLSWVIYSQYGSVAEVLKGTDPWQEFYATFPGSIGLIEASRAVISHDHHHALIYIGHYAHGLAGRGSLHYLTRTGKTWSISKSVLVWVS